MLLAGCSADLEPAQRSISDIEAVVSVAATDAAKYVPERLADVQSGLGRLQASFDKRDYAAVLAAAPKVMEAAQSLAPAAAARKEEITRRLNQQWTALAASMPDSMSAIQRRIDLLGRQTGRKPTGIDIDAARATLSSAESLWSKAQAAFATGNLPEAVATVTTLDATLGQLARELQVH
jgi:hypothetical protein